jgi:hypothetical protein
MRARDLTEATIRDIASDISGERPGNLSPEAIYDEIVRAIWQGQFEGAMVLEVGEADQDDRGNLRPPERIAFYRKDLRSAWCGNDLSARHRRAVPPYDVLATLSVADLVARSRQPADIFRTAYLDRLRIEIYAVNRWSAGRASPRGTRSDPGVSAATAQPRQPASPMGKPEEPRGASRNRSVRGRPVRDAAEAAIDAIWPNGDISAESVKSRTKKIQDWCSQHKRVQPKERTIQEVLRQRPARKGK